MRIATDAGGDPFLRTSAFRGLEGVKDEAVIKLLIRELGDPKVSSCAVAFLLAAEVPVEVFVDLLQNGSPHIRSASIEAIKEIGGASAAPALIGALTDSDHRVREAAACGLAALGWRPESDRQRALALGALRKWEEAAKYGMAAQEAFVVALADQDDSIQWKAAQVLTTLTDPVHMSEQLAANLGDQEASVRYQAARGLRWLGSTAVGPLLTALTDEASGVRYAACEALAVVQDPMVTQALEVVAVNDDHDAVRQAARKAIETHRRSAPAHDVAEFIQKRLGPVKE